MGLLAAFARPPRAGVAQRLVSCPRAGVKFNLSMPGGRRYRGQRSPMAETPATVTAPKHAMVLAAGRGTRTAPFSHRLPKPLVQDRGKALIYPAHGRPAAQ